MFRISILLFFLIPLNTVFTQTIYERLPYDYIWLFNNSRMDFNYDPVLITADDQPMPFEGTNASVCDEQGELLASTNGIYIADTLGDTISNSFYFNPGPHAEQWVDNGFIFPQMALFLKSSLGENYFLLHENVERLGEANQYGDVFLISPQSQRPRLRLRASRPAPTGQYVSYHAQLSLLRPRPLGWQPL